MLSVPHLDREFDYLVSAEQSDDAQPGVRVRVRFHGRLVDAFVLERRTDTDHVGKLGWLDRVVSAETVLTPEIRRLVDAVAARYAGTRPDVLRLAVPPRHARVERENGSAASATRDRAVDPARLGGLRPRRTVPGRTARVAAPPARYGRCCPGDSWADRFAEAAAQTVRDGPRRAGDRARPAGHGRAVARRDERCIDEAAVVALSAGLGPAAATAAGWPRCGAARGW